MIRTCVHITHTKMLNCYTGRHHLLPTWLLLPKQRSATTRRPLVCLNKEDKARPVFEFGNDLKSHYIVGRIGLFK